MSTRGQRRLGITGILSDKTLIQTGPCAIYWLTVSTAIALNMELNDSTDNNGTDAWAIILPAGGYAHYIFDPPIQFRDGVYLDVSGTSCKIIMGFE